MADRPTLLLTRRAAQSQDFLSALSEGLGRIPDHLISPIVRIEHLPFDDPGPVQALVFTSANGVEAFAAQHKPAERLAWCVGDSTAHAAKTAGFDARSADGDATALLEALQSNVSQAGGPVVHISGHNIARDLGEVLARAGYDARRVVAYAQVEQDLSAEARTLLKSSPVVAPIFSPLSAAAFARQAMNLKPLNLTTVAISQNAAVEGIGLTVVVAKPTRKAMIEALIPLL